jgi:hypothetical protein
MKETDNQPEIILGIRKDGICHSHCIEEPKIEIGNEELCQENAGGINKDSQNEFPALLEVIEHQGNDQTEKDSRYHEGRTESEVKIIVNEIFKKIYMFPYILPLKEAFRWYFIKEAKVCR